jgi:simple sugar transport system ATP-binding protein
VPAPRGIGSVFENDEAEGMPEETITTEPLLRIDNVTKLFPDVIANSEVSIDILPGEIHCLLGENGAGKTTLADILYGVSQPDEGEVYFKGELLDAKSPHDAIAAGIGMVHQHFELVSPMSALENVVIGTSEDPREARLRLEELCTSYDVDIDLDVETGRLSVGEQQWVEILKALYGGLDLLILDEPTAVLTPQGVRKLFEFLNEMKSRGLAIVFITHKLWEVMEVSDRVSVLRRGKLVDTVDTADTTTEELAKLMVGRDVFLTVDKEDADPGATVLEVEDIRVEAHSARGAVRGLSLFVRENEILGIAGVSGNGQKALFDALVGVRQPTTGKIRLDGEDVTFFTPKQLAAEGVAAVPADRIHQGLMMDFPVKENLVLGRHKSPAFQKRGFLNKKAIDEFAEKAIADYEIMTPSGDQITRVLSGGNLQKIILARELANEPRVLIVHQPTRGLDIGASEYVRRRIVEERDRGAAVILMSEDLDETFNLADRIAVIYEGQIIGELAPEDATYETVGMLMAGITEQGAVAAGEDGDS